MVSVWVCRAKENINADQITFDSKPELAISRIYAEARGHFKKTHSLLEVGLLKNSLAEVDISADSASKANGKLVSYRQPQRTGIFSTRESQDLASGSSLGVSFFLHHRV